MLPNRVHEPFDTASSHRPMTLLRRLEVLLAPQVNANALTWAADAHKARTSTNSSVGTVRALYVRWS